MYVKSFNRMQLIMGIVQRTLSELLNRDSVFIFLISSLVAKNVLQNFTSSFFVYAKAITDFLQDSSASSAHQCEYENLKFGQFLTWIDVRFHNKTKYLLNEAMCQPSYDRLCLERMLHHRLIH
jgi:hypothetical protein